MNLSIKAPPLPQSLLRHPGLWRGSDLARTRFAGVPSGSAALDAQLPGGGWPVSAVTEILPAHEGIGELRILGPALAALSAQGRHLVWVAPPYLPYAPALAAAGIDMARLLIVRTGSERDTLWAVEQALASNACGAVLAWLPATLTARSAPVSPRACAASRKTGAGAVPFATHTTQSMTRYPAAPSPAARYPELRRLQLAAERGQALALLFRPPDCENESSPAALRIAVSTQAGGLAVRIFKRRGGAFNCTVLLPASPLHTRRAASPAMPAAPLPRATRHPLEVV